jgi:predicted ATPase
MKIESIRLTGIRSFEDTGDVQLGRGCNLFVGQNNSGKSTLLKAALVWQGFWFEERDIRAGAEDSSIAMTLAEVDHKDSLHIRPGLSGRMRYAISMRGPYVDTAGPPLSQLQSGQVPVFVQTWPQNFLVPFVARRKAVNFDQNVALNVQAQVTGTFANLYSRIDLLATRGRSSHDIFVTAVREIVGLEIVTNASANGKEAGFFFDDDNFVTLDRMGDGVTEMVALIAELCLAKNKLFVLEEPETNLHPRGLKALLGMVRESATRNQFMIATHSNIVVRELAVDADTKVFRVFRNGDQASSPSAVEEVERTPVAHRALLRELGYEFADIDLHDAWLFVEEASAESVINDLLIPLFAPELARRLRTYSAAGVTNLEPSVAEFQRLVQFVHLQPAYEGRLWVRADGDEPGRETIEKIRGKFKYLSMEEAATFGQAQFELFYPLIFREKVTEILAILDKRRRWESKKALRDEVFAWSKANEAEARAAWEASAAEPIALLRMILARIG